MTRHQKAAAAHVARELKGIKEPVLLYTVSVYADFGARNIGRRSDLFHSLYSYADIIPEGWKVRWLSTSRSPTADKMLYAIPPEWVSGGSDSDQLLLGGGKLIESAMNGWL